MGCKGLSLGVKEMFLNEPSASYFWTYAFIILVLILIILQMNYLNKSLDTFNTAVVTTVYYVLFTLFVMINSSLLFKELLSVSFEDFVGCMCGFSVIVCALFMIHFFKPSTDQNEDEASHTIRSVNSYALHTNSGLETDNVKKRDVLEKSTNTFKLIKASRENSDENENLTDLQDHLINRENVSNMSSSNSHNGINEIKGGNLAQSPKLKLNQYNFGMLDNKNDDNRSF